MIPLRRLSEQDRPRLKEFWTEQWGGPEMIVQGELIPYDHVEGFIYGDWEGLITYRVRDDVCEITSLDSLSPGRGVGTMMIDMVVTEAKWRGCRRVSLITTNDNLHALGFYQRRGFELVAIHRAALERSRLLKPSIPLIGLNNIPLHDEIELEMTL
jgi:GNAT superfamily N-acetyltransferase